MWDAIGMKSVTVWAAVIAAVLLTTACEKPPHADLMTPPSAYLHWTDRLKAALRINGLPVPPPCMETVRGVPVPVESDRCWRLDQPRRWRGIYVWRPEWRVFCPAPATECPSRDGLNMSWLEWSTRPPLPRHAGVLAFDFVGRHTAYHSDGKRMDGIVVDKLLSVREINLPKR
jgi:hypothetical protein